MKTKGYIKYMTKSGLIRYSSILIINRKLHHLGTHDDKNLAIMAHLKAANLIETMNIEEVKQRIRSETLPCADFSKSGYRNVFKHRNKFYFRCMKKGLVFCSSGYITPAEAYSGFIEHRLKDTNG